jgi:uncharacterized protein (TIGR00251 family)
LATLTIHVTPNAKTTAIVGWQEDGTLKLRLAAKPIDGEANTALIKALAKLLDVPKSAITLTHGATSRTKRLEISLLSPAEIQDKLTII